MSDKDQVQAARCPTCKDSVDASVDKKLRPFCSRRCADIDLGRWFNESYAVPVSDPYEGEASDEPGGERGGSSGRGGGDEASSFLH